MTEKLAVAKAHAKIDDPIGGLIDSLDHRRHPAHSAGQPLDLSPPGVKQHTFDASPSIAAKKHTIDAIASSGSSIAGDPSLPHVVIVDKTHHKTHLFEEDPASRKAKEIFTASDATGRQPGWTPVGRYTIVERHLHPTYTPTNGGDTVPAGPNNPLGPAKVRLADSSGHWTNIEMHGTNADRSIGNNASHGCVRHHNGDISKMFPFLTKGTPVYITDSYDPARIIKPTDFNR